MTQNSLTAPLAGIRVVDMTIALAGPYGTRILADLGAEVIKVDTRAEREYPAHLDLTARLQAMYPNANPGPESWNTGGFHAQLNRNKKSIALDFSSEPDRDLFFRLVASADCLVENFTPKVMPSLGLGFETLLDVNPKLVYVAMPGFGTTGPYSGFPAFAPTTEAASGFLSAVGYEDGTLVPNPMSLADFVGGLNAVAGLMAALWSARDTGKGALIDLSQVEAMATYVGEQYTGVVPGESQDRHGPSGNQLPGALVSGVYPTMGFDEWIAISIHDIPELQRLADLAGQPWGAPAAIATLSSGDGIALLRRNIGTWTRRFAKGNLAQRLQTAGIGAAPVQTAPDLFADPQLNALGFFCEIDDPQVGTYPYEGQPWHFREWSTPLTQPAPRVGEHTAEMQQELNPLAAKSPN